MNYATKQIYDNNAYRIKLDKTLSNKTCNKHLYKKQLSNKNLVLTTKMLTKKVENGLQQKVYNKLYQKIYIYIKKLHTAKMYTT